MPEESVLTKTLLIGSYSAAKLQNWRKPEVSNNGSSAKLTAAKMWPADVWRES